MNGIHDMGGMHGFGPVRIEPDEPVFHGRWEARVFGMSLLSGLRLGGNMWRLGLDSRLTCVRPAIQRRAHDRRSRFQCVRLLVGTIEPLRELTGHFGGPVLIGFDRPRVQRLGFRRLR